MSVIARRRPKARPGNAITRRIAGLPSDPDTGTVQAVFDPVMDVSIVEYGAIPPPDLSQDQTIPYPSIEWFQTSLVDRVTVDQIDISVSGFDVIEVPIDQFGAFQINGATFGEDKRVGSPVEDPRVQAAARKRGIRGRSSVAPLLAKLLPILLPPARARFGDVFDFPSDLYAYQRDGIKWLIEHEPGVLLADDMGLGKTVETVVALRQMFRTGSALRALIVAPRSVVTSWRRHLADWAPELQVIPIDGSKSERRFGWAAFWNNQAHVGIITYDSLVRDGDLALKDSVSVAVLDEIHFCKNPDTRRSHAVRRLRADRKWGLTGTPLENSVDDFANILTLLDQSMRFGKVPSARAVRNAASKMMIRRRIGDVLTDLPELISNIEYVDLLPEQRQAYDDAEILGINRLKSQDVSITHVLALITALKQICNQVDGESAKAEWLSDYLETAQEKNDKSLVFSQYVTSLDFLSESLEVFRPVLYTGQMTPTQRQQRVDAFQESSEHNVMLMSLRAGGVGLSLTAANRVVHFDSWWNPAVMAQATARVRRIGQTKQMFETTLVSPDTVEERIQRILDDKRTLFANVVDDLSIEGVARALTQDELYSLFGINVTTRSATETDELEPVSPVLPLIDPVSSTAEITSSTPFSNVLAVRKIIREAKGLVWWVDPHFSRRGLEDLAIELELDGITGVRIISRDISSKDLKDFKRFHSELAARGIETDWRTFDDQRLFHDRFLVDDHSCHNMPPVNLIYDRNAPYSQILDAPDRPPLEEWWNVAESVLSS